MLGGGGHASVLVDILKQKNRSIIGIVCPEVVMQREILAGFAHYQSDNDILKFVSSDVFLINGIGSLPGEQLRKIIFLRCVKLGYQFETVISSHAIVSPHAELGEGVQIMPGAIVQVGAKIGDNTIINSGSIIEHDCVIGRHNHIAPGSTLSGQVTTADQVYIGTGAKVINNLDIGLNSVIAAGAIVTKSVPGDAIVYAARSKTRTKKD